MSQQQPREFIFWLFGALYFVQGVITAYQFNFFKPHMDNAGIDAQRIAFVASFALIPFILKAVLGLISDRLSLFGRGHRLPYMILGVVLCSIAFFIAFFIDPATNFVGVAIMVLGASFAMALFDTTADAYAVEVIPPQAHDRVQMYMTSGRAAGMIILSFVFGLVAQRYGFSAIFLVISLVLLFPLIMLFQVQAKEGAERPAVTQFSWDAFRACIQPHVLLFAFFLTFVWMTFQAIDGLVTFYMSNELGAVETTLGNYGALKGVGMVGGAIGMNWLSRWIGRRLTAIITIICITLGGFLFSFAADLNFILVFGVVWGLVVGLQWTIYASITMGITDLRIAGTMFALLQMMVNIGLAVGDGVATGLTANFSFATVFISFALLNLLAIPFFLLVARRLHLL